MISHHASNGSTQFKPTFGFTPYPKHFQITARAEMRRTDTFFESSEFDASFERLEALKFDFVSINGATATFARADGSTARIYAKYGPRIEFTVV